MKNQRSSDVLITDDLFTFTRLADHIAAEAAMQKVLDRTLDDGSPVHSFQTSPCQPFLTTKSAAPDGASRLLRIPSRHALTRLNADDFGHSIKLPMNTPAQAAASLGVSNAVTVIREFLAFKPGIAEYGINIQRVQKIRSCEEPACMANTPHVTINSANLLSVQRSKPPSYASLRTL